MNWKPILIGAAVVAVTLFVYEALAGILNTNTSIFNPASYR